MKIIFLSNFYNHHQQELSRALYALTKGEYRFIATTDIPDERKKLGYHELSDSFVIQYSEQSYGTEAVQALIDAADVVITGSAPEKLLRNRKMNGKVIFRYSERPLKKGIQWWKYPVRWCRWHRENPGGAPIYMLCASAYTAADYAKFGMYKKRTYKWGYFPESKKYENAETVISSKNVNEILWCGRFLDWKHPDDVLKVAERLMKEGYPFHITMIGTGDMEEYLHTMAHQYGLTDRITFSGSMSPEKVREKMECAGIYLFTSDRREGWGAVLNESMNSGCAVVASHLIGAVPYLIHNNANGLIYESGNMDMLYEKTKYLLDHPGEQKRLGMAAYRSIVDEWNAEIAAARLMQLFERVLHGENCVSLFESGPCSFAESLSDTFRQM